MIASYLADTAPLLRAPFEQAPVPSLLLPEALEDDLAVALRARLDRMGAERFDVADRGRYACNPWLVVEELWADASAFASALVGTPHQVVAARWVRLGRGDYSLVKDDHRRRPAGRHLEITFDLSTVLTAEAEFVYTSGESMLVVPQIPRMMAIVQREPATTRYERPPTTRSSGLGSGADVVRLRLSLASSRSVPT